MASSEIEGTTSRTDFSMARTIKGASRPKLLAYLSGTVVAIAMTGLLYSLTDSPKEGWDLHAADLLLPTLLFAGWKWGMLRMPHWSIWILGALLLMSGTWSARPELTLYTGGKLAAVLLVFSSLRAIRENRREFWTPIIVVGVVAVIGSLLAQGILSYNSRAWGVSGNPNVTSGHAVLLLLNTSLWFAPLWGLLLATTGSRAALLAFILVIPLLLRSQRLLVIPVLIVLVLASLLFGNTYQYLRDPINQEGRWNQWQDSIEMIQENPWLGQGFDTTTQRKATNPHNIYLLLLQELGVIFGGTAIGILLWNCRSATLAAILVIGIFDHYFLTTAQGTYLLASMLAMQKDKRKEKTAQLKLERQSVNLSDKA